MQFTVHGELLTFLQAGVLVAEDVRASPRDEAMDVEVAASEVRLRSAAGLEATVAAVRTLYKRVGLDPTKTRPSSEALLRRLRKGERLPAINAVVDVGNWCSAETQLPFGLYDLDRVDGAVTLRVGLAGEEYAGIRKDVVHVAGRIALVDAQGPFGNPSSDSARTMVTAETGRVLVVIYAPRELRPRAVADALDLTSARLQRHCRGRETARLVV